METILFIAVLLAAIATIASGIWVATSLLTAVSSRNRLKPPSSTDVSTVDSEP